MKPLLPALIFSALAFSITAQSSGDNAPLLFCISEPVNCSGTFSPYIVINDAATYAWYADGQLTATIKSPTLSFLDTGYHTIKLTVTTKPEQQLLSNFRVKTACCWNFLEIDPVPSFYVKIFDLVAGNVVYQSKSVFSLPEVDIPMAVLLKPNTNYKLQVWDYDFIGNDDLLGTYEFNSSVETHDLVGTSSSISFNCMLAAATYTMEQKVSVHKPYITTIGDDLLVANSVAPIPAGTNFSWYLNGAQNVQNNTNNIFKPTVPGFYTVKTNGIGCETPPFAFKTSCTLQVSLIATNIKCPGVGNSTSGEIEAIPSNGYPGYRYQWSHGFFGPSKFTNLTPGTYTVTVTDVNGCTATQSATIEQPASLVLAFDVTNISCNGANDGIVTINATGGTPPYTYYDWADLAGFNNPKTRTGMAATTYRAKVNDSRGCISAFQDVTLMQPQVLKINASIKNDQSNQGIGSIDLTVTGGTPDFTFVWTKDGQPFPATTEDLSGLKTGEYAVEVTDKNGCIARFNMIRVLSVVGTEEPDWAKNVQVWPNPASNQVQITFNDAFSTHDAMMDIYDGTGRTISYALLPTKNTQIDCTHWPAGFYTIVLRKNGGQWRYRLAVNHY